MAANRFNPRRFKTWTKKVDSMAWFWGKRVCGQVYITNSTDRCLMQPRMLWRWQISMTMAFCLRDVRASAAHLTIAFTNMRLLDRPLEWKVTSYLLHVYHIMNKNLVMGVDFKRFTFIFLLIKNWLKLFFRAYLSAKESKIMLANAKSNCVFLIRSLHRPFLIEASWVVVDFFIVSCFVFPSTYEVA